MRRRAKKEEIYSLLPTSRQMSSDFLGSRTSVRTAVASEDKRRNHECPSLLFSPFFYCWVWCRVVWNIPWVSSDQVSQPCPLPTSCPSPAYWPLEWWVGDSPDAAVHALLNSQNVGALSTPCSYKCKAQHYGAAIKKVKSVLARPNTYIKRSCAVFCLI